MIIFSICWHNLTPCSGHIVFKTGIVYLGVLESGYSTSIDGNVEIIFDLRYPVREEDFKGFSVESWRFLDTKNVECSINSYLKIPAFSFWCDSRLSSCELYVLRILSIRLNIPSQEDSFIKKHLPRTYMLEVTYNLAQNLNILLNYHNLKPISTSWLKLNIMVSTIDLTLSWTIF